MKASLIVLLALLPLAAGAAVQPSFTFLAQETQLPPLPPTETPKPNRLGLLRDAKSFFSGVRRVIIPQAKQIVSKMPVRAPTIELDQGMVKAPNSSVDFKLLVGTTNVESTR